jgi:hypothetical protein
MSFENVAISLMLASYASQEAPQEPAKSKPSPVKATVQSRATKAPSANETVLPSNGCSPEVKVERAKEYLLSVKNAGKRLTPQGTTTILPLEVRNDHIKAIAAFIGYDYSRPFGSQELEARSKAARDLRTTPMPVIQEKVLRHSVEGYVKGMPDRLMKRLADFQARERLAVANIEAFEKEAKEATSEGARELALTLARAERDRLASIRADIGY